MSDDAECGAIRDVVTLRCNYSPPGERAVRKVLARLDGHMRAFIALSPFAVIGSSSEAGADVTPRGDRPGFVHVLDESTLLVPDWPGNNRLDTLTNIVSNPKVGILFLIPGVNETLRVNGIASVTVDPLLVQRWETAGRHPLSVMRVSVYEAYLHCAKALIRSRLWDGEYAVDRTRLPSYGQMLKDQILTTQTAEQIQAAVEDTYRTKLY
jgi:PPOX class probable FMN-dependent enzyme